MKALTGTVYATNIGNIRGLIGAPLYAFYVTNDNGIGFEVLGVFDNTSATRARDSI